MILKSNDQWSKWMLFKSLWVRCKCNMTNWNVSYAWPTVPPLWPLKYNTRQPKSSKYSAISRFALAAASAQRSTGNCQRWSLTKSTFFSNYRPSLKKHMNVRGSNKFHNSSSAHHHSSCVPHPRWSTVLTTRRYVSKSVSSRIGKQLFTVKKKMLPSPDTAPAS